MILGQGTAQTDDAIIAEYYQFLTDNAQQENPDVIQTCRVDPR